MKDSPGKSKPAVELPLNDNRVITGEKLIECDRLVKKEAEAKISIQPKDNGVTKWN